MSRSGVPLCLCVLFHITVIAVYFVALAYDELYVYVPEVRETFAGRLKYLTFWNEIIQTIYFGFCLYNDFFGSNLKPWDDQKKRHSLQNIRDKFFSAIAFPLGTFVVLTFWGIYALDRDLIYPEHLDKIIPRWLNHIMHTTVLPFLLLEQFLVYHHYPKRSKGLLITFIFAAIYLLWICWIAYYTGIWVYPILEVLDVNGKIMFFAGLLGLLAVIYYVGEVLNKVFWGAPVSGKFVKTQ